MWFRPAGGGRGSPGDTVKPDDPAELGLRCRRWNVPPEAVARAVRKVGSNERAVARELGIATPSAP